MKADSICILGGTGFVGSHLIGLLARRGRRLRVLSRHPQRASHLLVNPGVELVRANVHDRAQLEKHFTDCDAVINLTGILNESRHPHNSFHDVHSQLPKLVVEACRHKGVSRLLHMSALNADAARGSSDYLRTKGDGENIVHITGTPSVFVTTFQPSVIFGPGDSFFNRFAQLLRLTPLALPLACPDARFAPVYVGDVCRAFAFALENRSTIDQSYQLCGPRVLTLREVVEYTARQRGKRRMIIGLGDGLSRLQARILGMLPGTPFSIDNYLSLQKDSVCTDNALERLGITPTDIDAVVPGYLGKNGYRRRYYEFRKQAGREFSS